MWMINVNTEAKAAFALGIAVVASLLYAGCDSNFLVRKPPSSLTSANFYQTADDAVAAVNAAYASLQMPPLYSETYPKVIATPSDDILLNNTSGLNLDNFTSLTTSPQLADVWSALYQGVFRANLVLQHVPGVDMAEDLKQRILGEAHFLRALYYWHLATLWGKVPLVKKATPDDPEAAEIPTSEISEVYAFMIQDLERAIDALPVSYDASNVGRATHGAATALLGKVYLYAEDYAKAEVTLKEVIDSGVYRLIPDYETVISSDNEHNDEIIFAVQYHDIGGDVWGTLDNANTNESTLRDRLSLPEGGGGFGNLIPTQDLVSAFEEGDPRLEYSVWEAGDAYGEGMYNPQWSPTGYSLRKGMIPLKPFDAAVGTNWPIIRFADVLLMYAEAANENGHLQAALDAVNQVRARVDMPALPTAEYPVSNQQEMFEAIVHERRVELCFEHHRYNDLRRWGRAEKYLGDLGYQAPRHRYFPIPQAELDVNDALEQNPNY